MEANNLGPMFRLFLLLTSKILPIDGPLSRNPTHKQGHACSRQEGAR
jgi:hypothetical protein